MTLYTKWRVQTYDINFDSDGGSSVERATMQYGLRYPVSGSLPEPKRNGYIFFGWFTQKMEKEFIINMFLIHIHH